jgi:hypothetical protein
MQIGEDGVTMQIGEDGVTKQMDARKGPSYVR